MSPGLRRLSGRGCPGIGALQLHGDGRASPLGGGFNFTDPNWKNSEYFVILDNIQK